MDLMCTMIFYVAGKMSLMKVMKGVTLHLLFSHHPSTLTQ